LPGCYIYTLFRDLSAPCSKEIRLLNRTDKTKLTSIIEIADEETLSLLDEEDISCWTQLEASGTKRDGEGNKEDLVVELLKCKRQLDEDVIEYAEKIKKIGKNKKLKEKTVIAILATNVWTSSISSQMLISTSSTVEEAIQRIGQIRMSIALAMQKKTRNKRLETCPICKKQGHSKEKCFFKRMRSITKEMHENNN